MQPETEAPVFVRAMSRSGGTLVCTILDSHPELAMSYELYPNLLEVGPEFDQRAFAGTLRSAESLKEARALCPNPRFGTYLARYGRGGLSHVDMADHLEQIDAIGLHLSQPEARLEMIKLAGRQKAEQEGKSRWGMKFVGHYAETLERWPEARFVNVLRDGRDVFASQKLVMSAEKNVEEVANGWCANHRRFEAFREEHPDNAFVLRYEQLVAEPQTALGGLIAFLGLDWDDRLLAHHEQDLTIYSVSHLSGPRIRSPIDASQVGRYRRDLTAEELRTFEAIAGDALKQFGYVAEVPQ